MQILPLRPTLYAALFLALLTPSSTQAQPEEGGIWMWEGKETLSDTLGLTVECAPRYGYRDEITWHASLANSASSEFLSVELIIRGREGTIAREGLERLEVLPGENPFDLHWDPGRLDEGVYEVIISANRGPHRTEVSKAYSLEKRSFSRVTAMVTRSEEALESLRAHVAQVIPGPDAWPYARYTLTMAQESIQAARIALNSKDLPRADALARFTASRQRTLRAQLAFAPNHLHARDPLADIRLVGLAQEGGSIVVEGRPIFLAGAVLPEMTEADLSDAARLGINYVTVRIPPTATLADPVTLKDFAAQLGTFLDAAAEKNMTVHVRLGTDELPNWVGNRWPGAINSSSSHFGYDMGHLGYRQTVGRHFDALLPILNTSDAVSAISLLKEPLFTLAGDREDQKFAAFVEKRYDSDRLTLNRAWRERLASFEEISLESGRPTSAFILDRHAYQQQEVLNFVHWLTAKAAPLTPRLATYIEFSDISEALEEIHSGVRNDLLLPHVGMNAATSRFQVGDGSLAFNYPGPIANYRLFQSMNPNKALVSPSFSAQIGPLPVGLDAYTAIHGLVWLSALSGVSGISLEGWGDPVPLDLRAHDIRHNPEALEAFGHAMLDLNRLAPIVQAFQQAPPKARIVWSNTTQSLDEEGAYVQELQRAYEGCSYAGVQVGFISELQCAQGAFGEDDIVVVPNTVALSSSAFAGLESFIAGGGRTIRVPAPIPYDDRGQTRHDALSSTPNTTYVRQQDNPSHYLLALGDTLGRTGDRPQIRIETEYGYSLEGVISRMVTVEDAPYLFMCNLRTESVESSVYPRTAVGVDLISGEEMIWPRKLAAMRPYLVRIEGVELTTPEVERPAPTIPTIEARVPEAKETS